MRILTSYHGQPMTAAEFVALPEDGNRYEYLQGVATMMSLAGGLHGQIAIQISALLWNFFAANEPAHLFDSSTGFRLPNGDVRVPDIAVILPGRLPGDEAPIGFIEIPPDLAVEVISPNERYEDIQAKISQFLNWGVQAVWIVEPSTHTHTVTVHPLAAITRLTESDTLTGGQAVPNFTCPVKQLFPPPITTT